jgi:hypothetical protein
MIFLDLTAKGEMSVLEMRIFGSGQGRTRVFGEAYIRTPQAKNPRRTMTRIKKTISKSDISAGSG